MKNTWLFYIDDFKSKGTKKYFFRNYKIYRAYKWHIAEMIDKNGLPFISFSNPSPGEETRVYTNNANRYY